MRNTVIRKRMKGLLAFVLAFMLLFGNGLTVFANTLIFSYKPGDIINSGDVIDSDTYGSGAIIYIDNSEAHRYSTAYEKYTVQGTFIVGSIEDTRSTGGYYKLFLLSHQESSGGGHTHSMTWKRTLEPTLTEDGECDYICEECGHIEARQPVTFFEAVIEDVIKKIKEAPENGTVTVDNIHLRCLTDEIMEALLARPDVTLEVEFTDQKVFYSFTIPAGQAPTDGQEWYGYYYLGGVIWLDGCRSFGGSGSRGGGVI